MKNILYKSALITIILFSNLIGYTQRSNDLVRIKNIKEIGLSDKINLHFISPEKIEFVDLSTEFLTGDMPTEHIARVKIQIPENTPKEEIPYNDRIGVVTVVGQSFMAQYKLMYRGLKNNSVVTNIQIQPEDMQPLEFHALKLSDYEMKKYAFNIVTKKVKKPIASEKEFKLKLDVNNVYVLEDYVFVDVSIKNKTNLRFDIDDIKFSIEDKKIYKATNNQSIEVEPLFIYNDTEKINKRYRNVFVFKKFTYPNSKIFRIRLLEDQYSGRTIEVDLKYSDILKADSI